MARPFDLLEKLGGLVVAQSRPEAHRAGAHLERNPGAAALRCMERSTEQLIHELLEGLPAASSRRAKLQVHVFIERHRRSHILML